jgi:hypothetical protein
MENKKKTEHGYSYIEQHRSARPQLATVDREPPWLTLFSGLVSRPRNSPM